ncbi:pyridoxal-phosphate dependent enzyme [Streptomyces sp. NPDC047017]|uniref:threonine ammonia-lyase n=1 Tax=Streptomyces sp. NPDC047017 TaxID=3155024 RepID=UPI0033C01756
MLAWERIEEASRTIDRRLRQTPQFQDDELSAALGCPLLLKVETVNPLRSFKGRGADFYLRSLAPGRQVLCASAGNFGMALAWAGRSRGIPVTVFCARNANAAKVARIRRLGAQVVLGGEDFDEAKALAREHAAGRDDLVFVEDGDEPRIAEGAGTIAVELMSAGPDLLLVPVGNGALINGIGTWTKAHSPGTRVVGVCAAGAPAMAMSWHAGAVVTTSRPRTAADGVAVRVPVAAAVRTMSEVVDDVLCVDEAQIARAADLAREHLSLTLEPAGALSLAAALQFPVHADRPAAILTGANL